jgi:hypothetical protein
VHGAAHLPANCPDAAGVDKAALHIGAIACIHRFGFSLNVHVHFRVCVRAVLRLTWRYRCPHNHGTQGDGMVLILQQYP